MAKSTHKWRKPSHSGLRFSVPTNVFYNCPESSTNRPCFMQNKANLQNTRMNISTAIAKAYTNEQRTMNNERLFKANPNKANFETEDRGQTTEDRGQTTEDRGQTTEGSLSGVVA